MIHGMITKLLPNNYFIVHVRDKSFIPQLNKIISFIPDKVNVDNKRRQIFKFLRFLAQNGDHRELIKTEYPLIKGKYSFQLKQWIDKDAESWFRELIFVRAELYSVCKSLVYNQETDSFIECWGKKAVSLERSNASLKELIHYYESIKVYAVECGVNIDEWESQQEG